MVCVSPGMLETKVIVAPNSPIALAKDSTMPAMMPGRISGSVTTAKTQTGCAPSVPAASSSLRSTAAMDRRMARTSSGKPMMAQASAAPVQRNENTMPNCSARKDPMGPRRPKPISRNQPTTTGGRTSGRCTRTSSACRPQKRPRSSSSAMAMPGMRLAVIADEGDFQAEANGRPLFGRKPIDHEPEAALFDEREALLLEEGLRLVRAQEGQERRRVRIARILGERDRIDDRRMASFREGRDDAHIRIGCGIGLVDDPERRLAAGDEQERRAHVLGLRDLVLHACPGAEMLERRLAVFAGRHRIHMAHRQAVAAKDRGEIDAGLERRPAAVEPFGATSTRELPSRLTRLSGLISPFEASVIHPVEIGGDEEIGRGAGLDLLGERIAGGIGDRDPLAGLAHPGRAGIVERILQAGGGENQHIPGLGRSSADQREPREQQAEKSHRRKPAA